MGDKGWADSMIEISGVDLAAHAHQLDSSAEKLGLPGIEMTVEFGGSIPIGTRTIKIYLNGFVYHTVANVVVSEDGTQTLGLVNPLRRRRASLIERIRHLWARLSTRYHRRRRD